jgi:hypothetical protein
MAFITVTDSSNKTVLVNTDQIKSVKPNSSGFAVLSLTLGSSAESTIDTNMTYSAVSQLLAVEAGQAIFKRTLTNAEVLALATTTITLLPNPGAGKAYKVLGVDFNPTGASAALSGGAVQIKQGGATAIYSLAAASIQATRIALIPVSGGIAQAGASSGTNGAITIDAASTLTVFTGGSLDVSIVYLIVTV